MRSMLAACAALLGLILAAPLRAEPLDFTIAVYGDSLGDGVWSGLYTLLKPHPETKLLRRSKVGAGLVRSDYAQWLADLRKQLDEEHVDVAVVMFGANDQQGMRDENRKGYAFPSPGWRSVYGARVAAVLDAFKTHKATAIWVGLPIMRKDEANENAKVLNDIFETTAAGQGGRFLSLAGKFVDENGAFASHLVDGSKRLRQIRLDDGIHFTGYGYELLAAEVLEAIRAARRPPGPG